MPAETTKESPYAGLWRNVFAHVQREADAGRGPWLLTAAGRAWMAQRLASRETADVKR